jgi:hypothetical protein
LSGHDEAFLLEESSGTSMAARTTAILSRCVTRLGPLTTITAEHIRSLVIGDREALLLHLRRLTLGETISCMLACPVTECAQNLDLELNVEELLVRPYANVSDEYEARLEAGEGAYRVRFRLPNGGDQEAAASLSADAAECAALILQRCVRQVMKEATQEKVAVIPAGVADALGKRMLELDSQAEIVLQLTCPDCGNQFSALQDTATSFYGEVTFKPQDLYREVHLLALHYKWSQAEILSLSRRRRGLYLSALTEGETSP